MFETFPRLYLAGGATTVRTGGSVSPFADLNLKRDIDAGRLTGPDLDVTAPFLNGPTAFAPQVRRIGSAAEAREMVRHWSAMGATSYKGYMHLTRELLRAIIDEAHGARRKVTAHLCAVTYREAADLGIDNLEHGLLAATDFIADKRPDECPPGPALTASLDALAVDDAGMKSLQRHLILRKVAITSTLTVFETFAAGRPMAPPEALELLVPALRDAYVARWTTIAAQGSNVWSRILPKAMAWEKQFADAGGLLVAGTDPTGYGGVIPGFSTVRQVELLEEAGFSRAQAIRVATLNGARYLDRENEIGSLAPGKRADLVLYKGSLAADRATLRRIVWTMKAGTAYDSRRIISDLKGKVGFH
jgi:enamidase